MHRPVLVTPASELPISVPDVARLLNKAVWDGDDMEIEDQENIDFAIRSAIDHYQGWNGILGISLATREWRQDFDAFVRELPLAIGPVLANGMTITYRDEDDTALEIDPADYVLRIDAGGNASVRFNPGFVLPSGKGSITYLAGHDELPNDIRSAIMLRVQLLLDEAASDNSQYLERAEANLTAKYRRMTI